jgi:hypothetical protein
MLLLMLSNRNNIKYTLLNDINIEINNSCIDNGEKLLLKIDAIK